MDDLPKLMPMKNEQNSNLLMDDLPKLMPMKNEQNGDLLMDDLPKLMPMKNSLQFINTIIKDGDKFKECPHCDYKSNHSGTMKRHVKTVHDQNKEFRCDSCNFDTGRKENLKAHLSTKAHLVQIGE